MSELDITAALADKARDTRFQGQIIPPQGTTVGNVLTATATGSSWQPAAGGGTTLHIAIATLQKAATVDGGTSTSGSWQTYPLTTELYDPDGIMTLAASVITLNAGTFYAEGWISTYEAGRSKSRLRNTTAGTTLIVGGNDFEASGNSVKEVPFAGAFTVAAAQSLELQYRLDTGRAGNGLGLAPLADWGEVSVYGSITFTQLS